jgi:hypothetical protein
VQVETQEYGKFRVNARALDQKGEEGHGESFWLGEVGDRKEQEPLTLPVCVKQKKTKHLLPKCKPRGKGKSKRRQQSANTKQRIQNRCVWSLCSGDELYGKERQLGK